MPFACQNHNPYIVNDLISSKSFYKQTKLKQKLERSGSKLWKVCCFFFVVVVFWLVIGGFVASFPLDELFTWSCPRLEPASRPLQLCLRSRGRGRGRRGDSGRGRGRDRGLVNVNGKTNPLILIIIHKSTQTFVALFHLFLNCHC